MDLGLAADVDGGAGCGGYGGGGGGGLVGGGHAKDFCVEFEG